MAVAPTDADKKARHADVGSIPWVEKYRPSTIDDIAQQDEVVSSLRNSLETGELPNMMFYGPPGTGKTSVALALVQQFFGKEWRRFVKELNASDERGINAIREQVKVFAQLSVGANETNSKARFRIVILDEADSMTHDAQAALRRIMEEFVHVTRFIIICNYVSKIIEPLHSRCSKFRFQCISPEFQRTRIAQICLAENVQLAPGAMERLITLSKGDLRFAVTMLQTAVSFYGQVDERALVEVACAVPDNEIVKLMKTAQTAKATTDIVTSVRAFLREGYCGQQVLERLLDLMMQSADVSDVNKARCATLFSQVDERLTQGCDEELQLLYLFSTMRPLLQA
jgi:replication factor C subunit 2/4